MIMRNTVTTVVAFAMSLGLSTSTLSDDSPTLWKSAFQTHCIKCHGKDDKPEGTVNLLLINSDDDLRAHPELLEGLISVLKNREMPP